MSRRDAWSAIGDRDPLDLGGGPPGARAGASGDDLARLAAYRGLVAAELRAALGGRDLGATVLARSGVPERLRGWSTRRVESCPVAADDPERDVKTRRWFRNFTASIAHSGKRRIAMTPELAASWQRVCRWRDAPHGWLWLEGKAGTGKSTLAAALACDMTATSDLAVTWAEPTAEDVARAERRHPGEGWYWARRAIPPITARKAAKPIIWVDEHELMGRVRAGWKGDPAPLYAVSNASILFLDDLGTSVSEAGKLSDAVKQAIERLVCYRYDHKLPTVVTTNVESSSIREVYGDRVASRLRELVRTPIIFGGPDLRGSDSDAL